MLNVFWPSMYLVNTDGRRHNLPAPSHQTITYAAECSRKRGGGGFRAITSSSAGRLRPLAFTASLLQRLRVVTKEENVND
jgi:hypothetical protein